MGRRKMGIIIVVVGIIALAAIVYLMFFYKRPAPLPAPVEESAEVAPPAKDNQNKLNVVVPQGMAVVNIQPKTLTPEEVKVEDLKRMAGSFAERFGSYSNQSDYGNIRDLKIFMTQKMQSWADNYIAEAIAKKTDSSSYYGITSKAVTKEAVNFDDDAGQAQIKVSMQRRESVGTPNNASNFFQSLTLYYVKENSVWRVDDAVWGEK